MVIKFKYDVIYERRPKMSIKYNYDCIDCLFYDMCNKEYQVSPTTPACESFELLHKS